MSYRQAEKSGYLNAWSTLKLFSKKFCFVILMKLRTIATINCFYLFLDIICHLWIAHFYFGDYCDSKETHSSSTGDYWDQRGKKDFFRQFLRPRTKKEETFEISNLEGLCAWANLSGEFFESFWFPCFWGKERGSYLLFLMSVRRCFQYILPH